MSPLTNSPPPYLYEMCDDTTTGPSFNFNNNNNNKKKNNNNKLASQNYFSYSPSYSSSSSIPPSPSPTPTSTPSTKNINITCINNRNIRKNTNNGANPNNNSRGALLPRSFKIPKTVFSSTVVQFFSLMMIYSFCITALWMVFCTSYLLTFYDDARRVFCTSRVWARVKNGVRERIAMFGEDWEDFFQKYFDQMDGVDGNKNSHLGGGLNNNNNGSDNNSNNNDEDADWDDWLKSRMFKFVTAIAGPNVADKFKQSASACQSQQHKK